MSYTDNNLRFFTDNFYEDYCFSSSENNLNEVLKISEIAQNVDIISNFHKKNKFYYSKFSFKNKKKNSSKNDKNHKKNENFFNSDNNIKVKFY